MQYAYENNHSRDLIVMFSGWGCDYNKFDNLHDKKDVLILYDYQDLNLDFDFSKHDNIYVIAYSAGVFVASIMADKLPNVRQKVAVCGNPYLFDKKWGLSDDIMQVFREITLDNYLDFRRKYMVFSDEEYERYNKQASIRTVEDCNSELTALEKMYKEHKAQINPVFDMAYAADKDLIFDVRLQKEFYKDKLQIIKNARHHVFFCFDSFEKMLDIQKDRQPSSLYLNTLKDMRDGK